MIKKFIGTKLKDSSMFDVFLQIDSSDFYTFTGIGTLLLALASIIGLIITLRQDRDARYLEFLKDVDAELSLHLEKEKALEDRDECITYAYNYIDICERILFLVTKKKIPYDFIKYYYDFFNYALTMMWWYTTVYDDEHSPTESWPTLTKWLFNNEMEPYPIAHLPKKMREVLTTEKSESVDKTDKNTMYDNLKNYIQKKTS